jgi:ABC-type bacteriocin/lantibiotic exporter with double-glycine peptidase domain
LACSSASKFWEAEISLTKAREELNAKKYATADATIKTAISTLGIPEDAPRCQDCMDEGNLQFPAIEAAEIMGNIKYAAVARYDDFHELIEIYVRRQCHIVPDQEWTDHYTPQAPMSASSP